MKNKLFLSMAALLASLGLGAPAQAAIIPVELMLVIDGSGSISAANFTTQRTAYQNVLNSALIPITGEIAVGVLQFGTSSGGTVNELQTVFAPTVIDSQADKDALVAAVMGMNQIGGFTPLGPAITAAQQLLAALNHADGNEVIDVSTDGAGNRNDAGDPTNVAFQIGSATAAILAGIENINCLGIGAAANCNFEMGPDSFEVTVAGFDDLEAALNMKIAQETGQVPEPATLLMLGLGLVGFGFARRRTVS